MKPLVTKKYIFERKLDGKPIVVDIMNVERKERYNATRELFYETGVYKKLAAGAEFDGLWGDGKFVRVMHTVHFIAPYEGQPIVSEIEVGRTCTGLAIDVIYDQPHERGTFMVLP